jgi:hypothetical protein
VVTGLPGGALADVEQPPADSRRVQVDRGDAGDEPGEQLRVAVAGVPTPAPGDAPGRAAQPGHRQPDRGDDPARAVTAGAGHHLPPHRVPDRPWGGVGNEDPAQLIQRQQPIGKAGEAAAVEGQRRGRAAQQLEGALRGVQR